jgi:hypothetical protein
MRFEWSSRHPYRRHNRRSNLSNNRVALGRQFARNGSAIIELRSDYPSQTWLTSSIDVGEIPQPATHREVAQGFRIVMSFDNADFSSAFNGGVLLISIRVVFG